jgi:hypothetical protein
MGIIWTRCRPPERGASFTYTKDAMKTFISIACALALILALATTAYGQSSVDGYNDQGGQIQSTVDNGGGTGGDGLAGATSPTTTTTTTADDGGSLPFTGLDVALLAAAGGVLAAAGLGMRRLTRAPGTA